MPRSVQLNLPATEVEHLNRERLTTVDELNRERDWLAMVATSRSRIGMKQQTAAAAMGGISVQLYSAQETGAEGKHLSFRRMWALGPEFWREMLDLICEFHGISVGLSAQDEEDRRIGRAFREVQAMVQRSLGR